jgi:hypothetical protein
VVSCKLHWTEHLVQEVITVDPEIYQYLCFYYAGRLPDSEPDVRICGCGETLSTFVWEIHQNAMQIGSQ